MVKFLFFLLFVVCSTLYAQQFSITVSHDQLATQIGTPAIIKPGDKLPSFSVYARVNGVLEGVLLNSEDKVVLGIEKQNLFPDNEVVVNLPFQSLEENTYRVEFIIHSDYDRTFYESFYFSVLNTNKLSRRYSRIVHPSDNGNLNYIPDFRGNIIPDFSFAGYKGGGKTLPEVPVVVTIEPIEGDNTDHIQSAIDMVSSRTPDVNGYRGAVLLKAGVYLLEENLQINESGIVLRGEGQGTFKEFMLDPSQAISLDKLISNSESENLTLLIATGESRRTLIEVAGESQSIPDSTTISEILDQYVPVGSISFRVMNPEYFREGDKVIVERHGNKKWITELGMDTIPPRPNGSPSRQWVPFSLKYETTIKKVVNNRIFLDGALPTAIEQEWGGGYLYKYNDEGRIHNVGIEELRGISFWEKDSDGVDNTRHADQFLSLRNVRDSWVKGVTVEHFYSMQGAFLIGRGSKQISIYGSSTLIADKNYYSGVRYRSSVIHAQTNVYVGRYGFLIQGQSNLIAGCYAINNRHAYVVSARVTGPNVFLYCVADNSITTSHPHHYWSVAGLYDNVREKIAFMNRLHYGSGHGWGGANYVAWKTSGELILEKPPTAQNWAIGHMGKRQKGPFADYGSDGYWELTDFPLLPESLYLQQLEDRMGADYFPKIDFTKFEHKLYDNNNRIWNYPNPAGYYTVFAYNLEDDDIVRLKVYSIDGKLIALIDQGFQEAGQHEFFWETIDSTGNPLTNGIYIYKLFTKSTSQVNKLLILR
ncbi:MAG: T9SS type A sorting domain-containing protein [Bacteroidales bacterium]